MGSTNRFSTSTTVVPAAQEEGLLTNLASHLTVSWRLHPVSFSRSLLTAHDGTLDDHASSTRVASCVMGRKAKALLHNREGALTCLAALNAGPAGPRVMMNAPSGSSGVGFVEKCFVRMRKRGRKTLGALFFAQLHTSRCAASTLLHVVAKHRKRSNFLCRAPPAVPPALSSASSSQATGFGRVTHRVTPLTSPAAVTLACTHSRALFLNWAMSLAACLVWTV
jgi:hypothetical protein